MKNQLSSLVSNIITAISAAFLMANLKREWVDPAINTFLLLQIFILNFVALQENYKNWKNNKPQQ
jgi:hypothetical protein